LAAWLLFDHLVRRGEGGGVLLLAYWALNLPVIGQQIGQAAWQYPAFRNITLRLLEPLGALEEPAVEPRSIEVHGAASVAFEDVSVVAAGHRILENVSLVIPAGSHIAIVGASGAGKSSLVGLLLGWHRPAAGRVLVDGAPLEGRVERLRRETAWVDPAVHLWNRSLYANLHYGTNDGTALPMSEVIASAGLRSVLEKLPNGFETMLGEGGALVSGGEGQRVRLGRAMLRPGVRLAILDEPFRGLDCEQRRGLLAEARSLWRDATLLCITHDVASTRGFDRVIVLDRGRVVEDGPPAQLAAQEDSRYRAMLDGEQAVRDALWSDGAWRHLRLVDGRIEAA
jgi:ABC-type multidrug transport system fused ATPase/permease subunit